MPPSYLHMYGRIDFCCSTCNGFVVRSQTTCVIVAIVVVAFLARSFDWHKLNFMIKLLRWRSITTKPKLKSLQQSCHKRKWINEGGSSGVCQAANGEQKKDIFQLRIYM